MNTKANNPITLGIEMSNPSASRDEQSRPHSVAMWNSEGELLGSAPLPASARGSDAVMHAIASLGDQVGVSASSIGRVLVSVGPGGYTALRIATTSAKMLAHTLGASLIAVPSARVASIRIGSGQCPALVALASKKNRSHATLFEADGSLREVGIIDTGALASMGVRSIVSDHHLPASFAEMAGTLGIQIVPLVLDARDLLLACEGIGDCDPLLLAPLYAREPDAVTQWRARGS